MQTPITTHRAVISPGYNREEMLPARKPLHSFNSTYECKLLSLGRTAIT